MVARSVFNWTFNDVVRFLKDNGFSLNHIEGSHYFYIGYRAGQTRQVCIPFHGSRALKPRILKGIILQSGILKAKWLE